MWIKNANSTKVAFTRPDNFIKERKVCSATPQHLTTKLDSGLIVLRKMLHSLYTKWLHVILFKIRSNVDLEMPDRDAICRILEDGFCVTKPVLHRPYCMLQVFQAFQIVQAFGLRWHLCNRVKVLWSGKCSRLGKRFRYSLAATLALSLQNPYKKCISTYSREVYVAMFSKLIL